jgi:hypothetical protein
MKIVKYLIILTLTFLWALIILVLFNSKPNPLIALSIITLFYGLLIYLIWPVGTDYSEIAFNRFYKVLGLSTFLVASHVIFNNECPTFPSGVFNQSAGYGAVLLLICSYLGKLPTSVLLCIFGGYLIYVGYTKKPNPLFKRDWLKPAP